jgi:hypothetical protein
MVYYKKTTELFQMKHCSFRLEPSPKSEIGKGLKWLHTIYTLQIEDDIRRSSSTLVVSLRPPALEQLPSLPPTCLNKMNKLPFKKSSLRLIVLKIFCVFFFPLSVLLAFLRELTQRFLGKPCFSLRHRGFLPSAALLNRTAHLNKKDHNSSPDLRVFVPKSITKCN